MTSNASESLLDPPDTRLVAGMMIGVGVHAMEGFSMITALPAIVGDLDARPYYGAVLTAYLLGTLAGLVWAASATDRQGPERSLRSGLIAIALGLVAATAAPTIHWLLACRFVQGIGGGALTTVLYALVQRAFPAERRPAMLARLSLAWAISALALPAALGAIVDFMHWRWVFGLGLPPVALTAWLVLPRARTFAKGAMETSSMATETQPAPGGRRAVATGLTLVGAALVIEPPPMPFVHALVLRASGLLVALLALRELLPAGTYRLGRGLPASVATKALGCALFFGAEAHLPLALKDIHDVSSVFVGLVFSVAAVCWSAAAFLQVHLLPRIGAERTGLIGAAGIAVAVGAVPAVARDTISPLIAIPIWAIGAAGMGLLFNTAADTAMTDTPDERAGDTGMALGIADAFGAAFGTTVASVILNTSAEVGAPVERGLRHGWYVLLVLALPLLWATTRLVRRGALSSGLAESSAASPADV